jgi:hypothetical protein
MTHAQESLIVFPRAFTLAGVGHELCAGTYRVITYGEEIMGLTFLAYRETVFLQTPALEQPSARQEVFEVDGKELASVLSAGGEETA